jgi:outer membrane protein TolC
MRIWKSPLHRWSTFAAVAALLMAPRKAAALQPLDEFVHSAQQQNFDIREQTALMAQRDEEASQSTWKLSPVVSATAAYTRNQYAAIVTIPLDDTGLTRSATIQPLNQYEAAFSATLPVVDVGAWERIGAANRTASAAHAQTHSTTLEAQRAVAQAYFQVVANEAVLQTANARHRTAEANLAYVRTRIDAGVAQELDLKRATAELESTRQDIAEAQFQLSTGRRSLATTSGLEPSAGSVELPSDTLSEPQLQGFMVAVAKHPNVFAAAETALAAERSVNATRAGLYPTLSLTGSERITNATGFGKSPAYAVGATATWRFDGSIIPATAAAESAAEVTRLRAARALRNVQDVVYNDHQAVIRQIEKTRAARAQQDSSALAASLARQRYEAGKATYLDVLTAERDDFAASVLLIQASADLAYARIALRLAASLPFDDTKRSQR